MTRSGFTRDVVTGEDYDNQHYWTSRLGLTWRPTDGIENYLLGYYTFSKNNGTGSVIQGFNKSGLNYGLLYREAPGVLGALPYAQAQALANTLNVGCTYFNLQAPSTNCGQDIVAEQQARGVRKVQYSAQPDEYYGTGAAIDQFRYEINDHLTLRNIVSYSFLKHQFRWDFDASRAAFDEVVNPDSAKAGNTGQFTEEMQLQGTGLNERLKFVAGGYYQSSRPIGPQSEDPVTLFNSLPAETYGIDQSSYAPYAQATYDLGGLLDTLDGFKLTAGLRYTTDHVDGSSNAGGTEHSASIGKSALTYTAGLDKQIQATLLYGKISRGYKSGGFEAVTVNPADYTFKPEYVTGYEVGQKSDFEIGNVPARLNAAAYYTSYTNMQRAAEDIYTPPGGQQTNGGAIFNAGKAELAGLEMDGMVLPFAGFSLSATYALSYGKYDRFTLQNNGLNPQLDCTGQYIQQGGTVQLRCIPFTNVPKHQASLTARYVLPIDVVGGKMEGSATYFWTDSQYSSSGTVPAAEPGAWLGCFGLLNANLSWSTLLNDESTVSVRLFGTNLTNRTYRIGNSDVWSTIYFQSSIYGEPRVFGVQLAYGWGRTGQ